MGSDGRRALAAGLALLRRVPVWAWLTAIVVASAAFRALLGRGIVAPFIFVDELVWSELARSIADEGRLLLRGEPNPGYSPLYPLLVSPAYLVVDELPRSYEVVKALNAFLMSLAAVPAYLLARRLVSQRLALLNALLAVATPSLVYTGTVMTENVFYPLFLLLVLALVSMLERPTAARVAAVGALLVLAYATRVQAAALVPAVLLAPLCLAVLRGSGLRETVVRFRVLYGTAVALAGLALVVRVVGGRSPGDLLGAYAPVGEARYEVAEVLRYLVWHVAELGLYVLVVPVAATIVLVGRARSLDRPLQAFLAAMTALALCLLPSVAAFASVFSQRIQERNLFYLAPLLLLALLAWIERGALRPRPLAAFAAGASCVLVALVPFDRFLTTSAITDTLMLLPFWSLEDRVGTTGTELAALALALALAAAFLLLPARLAVVLPLLVLGLWAAALKPIWWGRHGFERAAAGALFQGIRDVDRDWIDETLPAGAEAAFLWTGVPDRLTVTQNEFFNRSVGPVYYLVEPTPGELPETRVTVDPRDGAVTLPDGSPVRDAYLVTDGSFEPIGIPLARDRGWDVTVWRVDRPLVRASHVDGLYPQDTWSGATVAYVRRRCAGGRLRVSLSSDASLFLEPQTVTARVNGAIVARVTFAPDARAQLVVPLAPRSGSSDCRVDFRVSPTAVPAEVAPGESTDDRVLGAHFDRFEYLPPS
ncbi:MAG: glycosyltransferase family 39 protein [Thermoleophilia bacterium]|nr:glycosyltransferase family 39 protein [Thermoleophilia bacterium]